MRKFFLLVALTVMASQAHSQKQFAGVFKAESGLSELVTTFEKPCDKTEGNANVISGNKQRAGCWVKVGDDIKFDSLDGTFSKTYASANIHWVAENLVAPVKVAAGPKKSHLTCEADGWQLEMDVERNENGDLTRLLVAGDSVLASEKSTQIAFSYDGLAFNLNTITGKFTYETSGVQSYIRKNLMGTGKSKGTGACHVNELVKKF